MGVVAKGQILHHSFESIGQDKASGVAVHQSSQCRKSRDELVPHVVFARPQVRAGQCDERE
jgi:hypothetical protein